MNIKSYQLNYRKATIDDLLLLVELRLLFLKEIQTASPEKEIIVENELVHFINRTLADNTLIPWVAEYQRKAVGAGWLLVRDQPPHYHILKGRIGIILSIYTQPEFRKNGIGFEIMKYLIEEGRQLSLERLELRATKEGEKLYSKLGFTFPEEPTMELNLNKYQTNCTVFSNGPCD
jgi:GNAT superfamily N-acetyltransferase